jgi:hypothetical protein
MLCKPTLLRPTGRVLSIAAQYHALHRADMLCCVALCFAAAAGRKADVDKVFREASSMGMTAARTWAHSISQKFPFQIAAGEPAPGQATSPATAPGPKSTQQTLPCVQSCALYKRRYSMLCGRHLNQCGRVAAWEVLGRNICCPAAAAAVAGKYDESGLEALDYIIASAAKNGVKLILSFIDNWKYYNGVDQFVDWCIPERKMPVPKESGGDTDTDVRTTCTAIATHRL